MQTGMQSEPFYSIELLERFYAQDNRQKLETLIHELLHIPKAFGGGLKGHKGHITHSKIGDLVEELEKQYNAEKKD